MAPYKFYNLEIETWLCRELITRRREAIFTLHHEICQFLWFPFLKKPLLEIVYFSLSNCRVGESFFKCAKTVQWYKSCNYKLNLLFMAVFLNAFVDLKIYSKKFANSHTITNHFSYGCLFSVALTMVVCSQQHWLWLSVSLVLKRASCSLLWWLASYLHSQSCSDSFLGSLASSWSWYLEHTRAWSCVLSSSDGSNKY